MLYAVIYIACGLSVFSNVVYSIIEMNYTRVSSRRAAQALKHAIEKKTRASVHSMSLVPVKDVIRDDVFSRTVIEDEDPLCMLSVTIEWPDKSKTIDIFRYSDGKSDSKICAFKRSWSWVKILKKIIANLSKHCEWSLTFADVYGIINHEDSLEKLLVDLDIEQ